MRPDQLPLLTTVSAPAVHPDGDWAVVASSRPDFDADSYVGQLWRVPLDGGAPRRLTLGQSDSQPRFSPDGSLIGFLRDGANDRPQVHLIPSGGGEPLCVTNQPLGVSDFAFSPDGRLLAFIARVPQEGRYGTLDGVAAGQEDPRHITSLAFQYNGLGWSRDRRSQLFVVEVPDVFGEPPVQPVGRAAKQLDPEALKDHGVPRPTQLTTADTDHGQPCFTADGSAVLVVAGRPGETENLVGDLLRVGVDGGEVTRLTDGALDVGSPVEVDGTIWFTGAELGESGLEFVSAQPSVYRLGADGPQRLTDPEILIEGDLVPAGNGVLTVTEARGASQLLRVTTEGTEVLLDSDAAVLVVGCGVTGRTPGAAVLVGYRSGTSMGDLGLVADGRITALTDFSASLRAGTDVREPRELEATSSDGYPVHGWVVTPAGEGPHPLLLMIHGGPFAQYTSVFFDEAQVYAEAGYAVVMCNPRGSAGYGPEHGRPSRAPSASWTPPTCWPSSITLWRPSPAWTATASASWVAPTAAT
ncbi:MAG: S9 family peptidase [Micropruina sp.]|uniref:S9 family peptidase n=1 Tax=Micropruina sp. TaxID=2737536 RepID=UPI0039E4EE85